MDKDSIDEQIRRAKQRAEEFSNSLLKARSRETEVMEIAGKHASESEHRRLSSMLEEKNAMVEQLQRELHSTVDALQAKDISHSNKYALVDGLGELIGGTSSVIGVSKTKMGPSPSIATSTTPAANKTPVDTRELAQLKAELNSAKEELVLLRSYRVDAEGKLQFRLEQVMACEEQKARLENQVAELKAENIALQEQLSRTQNGLKSTTISPGSLSVQQEVDDTLEFAPILVTAPEPLSPFPVPLTGGALRESVTDSLRLSQALDVKSILQDTKRELNELARASQTQELLQRFLDDHDVSEVADGESADYSEEPVFSRRIKSQNKSRASSSADSLREAVSPTTATSSILSFTGPYKIDEPDEYPLMSSVTNLSKGQGKPVEIATSSIVALKAVRPQSAPSRARLPTNKNNPSAGLKSSSVVVNKSENLKAPLVRRSVPPKQINSSSAQKLVSAAPKKGLPTRPLAHSPAQLDLKAKATGDAEANIRQRSRSPSVTLKKKDFIQLATAKTTGGIAFRDDSVIGGSAESQRSATRKLKRAVPTSSNNGNGAKVISSVVKTTSNLASASKKAVVVVKMPVVSRSTPQKLSTVSGKKI